MTPQLYTFPAPRERTQAGDEGLTAASGQWKPISPDRLVVDFYSVRRPVPASTDAPFQSLCSDTHKLLWNLPCSCHVRHKEDGTLDLQHHCQRCRCLGRYIELTKETP